MNIMRHCATMGVLLLALTMLAAGVSAANYVSYNGKFYVSYPDDWIQVDYQTVDYFLYTIQANEQAFRYEAVFAPSASIPFHSGDYLILSLDTVGALSDGQVDSVLSDLADTYDVKATYRPADEFLAGRIAGVPNYDRQRREIMLLSNITEGDQILKRNLWVMKIYEGGIANFYFFAPDSAYGQSQSVFMGIVNSFSTENIETALPQEQVKLANVDTSRSSQGPNRMYVLLGLLVVFLVVISTFVIRKRKSSQINERKGP